MELKKESTEKTELEDISLDSMFDTPVDETLKQTISEDKKHLTNDYARSGTNTSYVGGQAAEWDESIEKNSFRMTEEQMKKTLSKSENQKTKEKSRFLTVMEFVVYLAFAFLVVMIFTTSRLPSYDIPYNMKNVSLGIMVLAAVLFVDAIVVFALEAKKPMLFVFAILLGVFYPIYRNKIANGRAGVGIVCTLLTFAAMIMLFVTAGQGVTKYGEAIIKTEDEFTRHEAVALWEQQGENGKEMGLTIKKLAKNGVEDVESEVSGDKTKLIITGTGPKEVNIVNDTYKNENGLKTVLEFEKKSPDEAYSFSSIKLDEKELSDKQMKQLLEAAE